MRGRILADPAAMKLASLGASLAVDGFGTSLFLERGQVCVEGTSYLHVLSRKARSRFCAASPRESKLLTGARPPAGTIGIEPLRKSVCIHQFTCSVLRSVAKNKTPIQIVCLKAWFEIPPHLLGEGRGEGELDWHSSGANGGSANFFTACWQL